MTHQKNMLAIIVVVISLPNQKRSRHFGAKRRIDPKKNRKRDVKMWKFSTKYSEKISCY